MGGNRTGKADCGTPGGDSTVVGASINVIRFAKDEATWFKSFGPAWEKAAVAGVASDTGVEVDGNMTSEAQCCYKQNLHGVYGCKCRDAGRDPQYPCASQR